jgi:ribulose-phosphate 3-epimerase
MKDVKILPSLLPLYKADFSIVNDYILKCQEADADAMHLDLMDGKFVPENNITYFTPDFVKRLFDIKDLKIGINAHLMFQDPFKDGEKYIKLLRNSDSVTFHIETKSIPDGDFLSSHSEDYIIEMVEKLRERKLNVGIALNPNTYVSELTRYPYVNDKINHILLMSVHPGRGGQKFIKKVLEKVPQIKRNYNCEIWMDGGINEEMGKEAISIGVTGLIVGNYIYNGYETNKDVFSRIKILKSF